MRRGRALNKSIRAAVAAVGVPLALAAAAAARQARAADDPAVASGPVAGGGGGGGSAAPQTLNDEPLQLAQLRRPPRPGQPPVSTAPPPPETAPTTGPAGPAESPETSAATSTEPRVVPTMPSELELRPALPPRTPANPGYVGYVAPSPVPGGEFLPVPDRWRLGQPSGSAVHASGNIFDPYNQNVLKGDYPILGTQDIFFILGVTNDTLFEARRLPIPSGVSTLEPRSFEFFGNGHSQLLTNNLIVSTEIFKGNAAYQPKDFVFRATGVMNINYVHFNELGVVKPDVREGRDRTDDQFAMQELFVEKKLADLSDNYDFVSVRAGIQGFVSDFKGFLFSDNEPGVRLFGNWDNNRWQYNLAFFNQVEKDTNSGLNEFNARDQQIFIANLYRQDFLFPGYTAQVSFHANFDHSSLQYDENGFLARPQPIGTVIPKTKDEQIYYLGWAGDGHIGRFNLTHQYYFAFGSEGFNPISGKDTDVSAQFFAIELSYDQDYVRYRASFEYASGDHDPTNGKATGFDSIFDNPNFAGGGLSFFTRQAIALTGTGTGLTGRFSPLPDLRTSKEQGQANFVNPGLMLFNLGVDVDVTQKLKVITNASYLRFDDTSSLRYLLQDDKIGRDIGFDLPLLNNNIIFAAGAAVLIPGQGFKDIYTSEMLYSTFVSLTLTY
jgi:hypothetical protein